MAKWHIANLATGNDVEPQRTYCGRIAADYRTREEMPSAQPGEVEALWEVGVDYCALCMKHYKAALFVPIADILSGEVEDISALSAVIAATDPLASWVASAEQKRALRNFRDFGRLALAWTDLEIINVLENLQWVREGALTDAGKQQLA